MKLHANAALGPKGRAVMVRRVVEEGWSLTQAAEAAGVSERTCQKWVQRYRREGEAGLEDRSSAPARVANRTDERRVEAIAALRRLRMSGAEIAECLEMALSTVHAVACRILGIRHLRTRPYRPQTNGKAERFIRTLIAGWAYGAIYGSSPERTRALDGWLWTYNHRRPHGSLSHKPPAARLNELNNLARSYI